MWRPAGQEETGTATTQESHPGPAGESSTTLREPAVSSATPSDKKVLELGRRHTVPSPQMACSWWCEDGGGSPTGHASLSRTTRLTPSDMNGASPHKWEQVCRNHIEEHLAVEPRSLHVTCSKKMKALLSYGLPGVSPALRLSEAMSGQHLCYSSL